MTVSALGLSWILFIRLCQDWLTSLNLDPSTGIWLMMSSESKGGAADKRLEPVESERSVKSEILLRDLIGNFFLPNRSFVVLFEQKFRN